MNREELSEAILALADSPHMRQYVIEHAMAELDVRQLGELFDTTVEHHAMLHPVGRRRVPRNPRPSDQTIKRMDSCRDDHIGRRCSDCGGCADCCQCDAYTASRGIALEH